jgi:hypothetical protein
MTRNETPDIAPSLTVKVRNWGDRDQEWETEVQFDREWLFHHLAGIRERHPGATNQEFATALTNLISSHIERAVTRAIIDPDKYEHEGVPD